jgi:glycosyltransferase involved in cell wall biosynthesis
VIMPGRSMTNNMNTHDTDVVTKPGAWLRWGLSILTLGFGAIIVRQLRSASKVPLLAPAPPAPAEPQVAVIVPARDEAARILRLLDGLATQTTRNFEVLVLDDHSADATAAVVTGYAPRLPQLHLIEGASLPPGWAGKCWACWQAAHHATAPWFLFLDADTAPAPAMISTLIQYADTYDVDLLTLLPLLELETFWERVLMPPFVGLIQAAFPLDQVNDPRSSIALANGQCLLIKRDVYFASGGHRAVRDSVLEDTEFAQVVKGQGYRLRAVGGPELMRVRMYTRLSEVAEGLRKNAWAGYAAGGWRSAWAGVQQGVLAFVPMGLVATGAWLRWRERHVGTQLASWGLLLWAITTGYWGYVIVRLHRLNPLWALLYPFGTLSYFVLAGWAWLSLRLGRGVTWKGRTYQNRASTNSGVGSDHR